MLQHFGDGLELGKAFQIDVFFSFRHLLYRHIQPVFLIESGDDLGHGHSSPGVEEIFVKFASPFRKSFVPGHIMERHGIGDGAVAIEQVGLKRSQAGVLISSLD